MITKIFLLELLLTFLIASCWIYLTVYAGLRLGSKIGGFIGGLPSTALLSFFFIGFTESPQIASSATTVFPIAISASVMFLVVYAAVSRYGFWPAMLSGLCFWFLTSVIIDLFNWGNFSVNLIIYAIVIAAAYLILEKYLSVRSVIADKNIHSQKNLMVRSMFGGLAVMLTVIIAKIGGPQLGGITAAFPAMYISMLTISYMSHGIEFSKAITKPLMVTGMITVAVFAIALRYSYIETGLYAGTLLAVGTSAFSALLTYRYILPRLK